MKGLLIIAVIMSAAILFVAIYFIVTRHLSSPDQPPGKRLAENSTASDQELVDKDLSIDISVQNKDEADKSRPLMDGEDVKVIINLKSSGKQQSRFLTIKTNLLAKNFYNVRDIKGVTGVSEDDGKISLPNIILRPEQTQDITFGATFFAKDVKSLAVQATLIDSTGKEVVTSSRRELQVQ